MFKATLFQSNEQLDDESSTLEEFDYLDSEAEAEVEAEAEDSDDDTTLSDLLEQPDLLESQMAARGEESEVQFLIDHRMSIYDIAKLIGYRASQIARGAIPLVTIDPQDPSRDDPIHIAQMEFNQSKIPFGLQRGEQFHALEELFNPHIMPHK